ncbi:hypothetical protein [Clostridium estertheticum]|uniref:hypothetical protein n=1 Tax=Clostridium estertheticum TaxID=238834 RepID=UPI001C0E814D|nr:hypothetical protein [Clostridium estertheticum]MBU3072623.1 hypothetical protein [Clostridium estertheticum]MBU3162716.1 hypothetical protein [Clostridium estertheticum]MBU3184928.1 hypothetical protein [Clostridium estertheticum]
MDHNRKLTTILSTVTVTLSIVVYIASMALNFTETLLEIPITTKNVIITLIYISVWIFVPICGIIIKSRAIIQYSLMLLLLQQV